MGCFLVLWTGTIDKAGQPLRQSGMRPLYSVTRKSSSPKTVFAIFSLWFSIFP